MGEEEEDEDLATITRPLTEGVPADQETFFGYVEQEQLLQVLVQDEYTRYEFPRLLQSKDKAAEALLHVMKRARMVHSHSMKSRGR